MHSSRKRLGELLVSHKLLTAEQLEQALALQRERFQPLGQILIQLGFITEERLLQACALQQGVAVWQWQKDQPTPEALALIPAELCRNHLVLPISTRGGRLLLAMRDPDDVDAIDMVRNITRLRIEPALTSEERLLLALDAAYGPASTAMNRFVSQAMSGLASELPEAMALESGVSDAEMRPVVALVNQILVEAIRMRASDIHVEPRKDRTEIRYRVDGQLQRVHEIPPELQASLVSRIKVMAQLDIVEYRIPQDGRMTISVDGRTVDIRVSVLPTYHGQRIALRILDKSVTLKTLPELGLCEHNLGIFQDMISRPYGLLLVTGPTGSGKTTTLYAAINQLKEVTNNIMTCEDPVEYDLDGINQSHVNERAGLSFASQLRAILRQDPDIILVGEIRDRETADTAIRAALTGHLVLSTLHCNDAPSAIPRLTDMGVEPYLLSTALIGVMAQRLVRVLCPHCKQRYTPGSEERALLGPQFEEDIPVLWRSTGCPQCSLTGYRGRTGIHEILPVAPEVERAIANSEPIETVRRLGAQAGYRSLQVDACDRVLAGETALGEVRRQVSFGAPIHARTFTLLHPEVA